jgi:small conductance mechanosensitive channel
MTLHGTVLRDLMDPASTLGALAYAAAFFLCASLLSRALRVTVKKALAHPDWVSFDQTGALFLTQLAQISIFVLAFTYYAHVIPALRSLGTALLASAGVASVVVGLAAQNTLGNIVAGVSLLMYRPFRVQDIVEVTAASGLETGTIESLTLGYTILKTYDNRRIVVPNSVMATQVTVNLTSRDPRVMLMLPIGVGYGSDLDRARAIIVDEARSLGDVQEVVDCPVTELGASAVTLTLRAWCTDATSARRARFALIERVKKQFDRHDIEIPFPYTNVVLKGNESRAPSPGTGTGTGTSTSTSTEH